MLAFCRAGVSWAKPKIRISRRQSGRIFGASQSSNKPRTKTCLLAFSRKVQKSTDSPVRLSVRRLFGGRTRPFGACAGVRFRSSGPEPALQAAFPAAYGREFVRLFRRPGQGNIESKNVDNNEKIVYLRTFVSAVAVRAALPALLRRAEAAAAAAETWRGR